MPEDAAVLLVPGEPPPARRPAAPRQTARARPAAPALRTARRNALATAAAALLALNLWCAGELLQRPGAAPLHRAAQLRLRIDPNTASAAELALLPAIGPARAAAIVNYRESAAEQRAFDTVEDLDPVRGIGPATLREITPWIDIPPAGRQLSTAPANAHRGAD